MAQNQPNIGSSSPEPKSSFNDGRRPWQSRPTGKPEVVTPREDDNDNEDRKKTFADVEGCDEAIAKLKRVCKWLKHSKWYALFRARIPKGVLLVGPPGTGKTLLAQILAGETDANFFSASASEFVEMYVGVGASRVRDLFDKAKAEHRANGKPSIIFIDELDAIGKKRSGRNMSGEGERDQTLNQLLTAMQGFKPSSGILVVAATNLPETLDDALLRPGRFDYHVTVDYPDINGREKIFAIHTRHRELAPNVRLRELAMRTTNFSGAHIDMVCNEAAVIAAERQEAPTLGLSYEQLAALPHEISLEDFDKAIDYVLFGDELLSRTRSQKSTDAWKTCIHEAGHAVIATATGGDTVTKITRIIRSKSLGMMQAHSEVERYCLTEADIRSQIMTALAGQASQLDLLQLRDTGSSSDLEQGNKLARFMVGAYGMSEGLCPIQIKLDSQGFPAAPLSPFMAEQFDRAWTKIMFECWEETNKLVKEHRDKIIRVAHALMKEETILAERFKYLYENENESLSDAPSSDLGTRTAS
jgi:cell division protease FtsH